MKNSLKKFKTKTYKVVNTETGVVKETRELTLKEKSIISYAYALNQTGLKLIE